MELHLTAEQKALIREGMESGRLQRPEDAFEQAMLLWEERERRRMEILAAVRVSEASLARGDGRSVVSREQASQLAEDVRQRGMERMAEDGRLR